MNAGSEGPLGTSQANLEPRHTEGEQALNELANDPATSDALRAYLAAAQHRDVADLLNELETILPLLKAKFQNQLDGANQAGRIAIGRIS